MKILIKNGTVVDPKNNINKKLDLLVEDNKILKVEQNINESADEIVDANGCIVTPGLIDMHVHLREPGFEYKETILTGTSAAARGGVTSVACMPNTNPAIDTVGTVKYIQNKAKEAKKSRVFVIGAISKNISGSQIAPIQDMIDNGIVAISDDGKTTADIEIMKEAYNIIKKYDMPLISHSEDVEVSKNGCINDGEVSKKLGVVGIPNAAEANIVNRDIKLCEETDSRLHICHVSTKESMGYIMDAKKRGTKVTVEVCPHHFILTDDIIKSRDYTYAKVNPPIRSAVDRDYLLECIKNGDIDCIVTDHAPHDEKSKGDDLMTASFGISSVECSFGLSYTYLVKKGIISLDRLIEMMSVTPAKLLHKDLGHLTEGSIADITIIDLNKEYEIDNKKFVSKGKNTPFNGFKVFGEVKYTIVDGNIVYRG